MCAPGYFKDAINKSVRIASNDRNNNEVENMWKEAFVIQFDVAARHVPGWVEFS